MANELLSISLLESEIKKILNIGDMSSCVLLLDDAAHAFSKEQQYDFFEFFRNIKSREISPKAAIYPGVTNFSASFHVGHDAEEIDVWIKVTDNDYIEFMTKLLQKRFPVEVFGELTRDKDLLSLICYSSFGIPRALLNIVHNLCQEKKAIEIDCGKNSILMSIRKVNGLFMNIYKSLEEQLPIYKEFVRKGVGIYETLSESLKQYNKEKDFYNQAVEVGIKKPIPVESGKVFNFFQYAGLLMYDRELSRGENGRYAIYIINYGFLVEQNVFGGKTNIKKTELAEALRTRNMHEYKRLTVESLLGEGNISDIFPFSLPPCPKCNTPGISADTKFCSECGERLITPSLFEELVKNDICRGVHWMISWKDCVNKSAENERIQDIQSYLLKESSAYKAPIDAFYTEVKKIVMYSSDIQMLEENDFLGPLLFVGIISGTENYIREILTECIKTDSYYVYINSIYISGIYRFHTWYTGVLQNCTGRKRGLMWQN